MKKTSLVIFTALINLGSFNAANADERIEYPVFASLINPISHQFSGKYNPRYQNNISPSCNVAIRDLKDASGKTVGTDIAMTSSITFDGAHADRGQPITVHFNVYEDKDKNYVLTSSKDNLGVLTVTQGTKKIVNGKSKLDKRILQIWPQQGANPPYMSIEYYTNTNDQDKKLYTRCTPAAGHF